MSLYEYINDLATITKYKSIYINICVDFSQCTLQEILH